MDFTRLSFLGLTLLALAFPVRRYVMWFTEYGFDWERLVAEVTITEPATGLVGSILIASVATIIFIIGEAVLRRDWLSLICVPITLIFGVGVGLPFYLYLRLRPLHRHFS